MRGAQEELEGEKNGTDDVTIVLIYEILTNIKVNKHKVRIV